ncbi:Glutamate mutase subunit E [Micromonospora viridifaciens]|uniref:Glutamate mutase subunit E n=1 Tax=Micromonospora viridifaciens TaxID=1881 RepID=A0A1C4X605_MICVI|nr:methylaspartate mutase [Micromonospora viridifaciens]SCF03865.1 Glutamate mutase subunit E [Micromonospora viridifaciens]
MSERRGPFAAAVAAARARGELVVQPRMGFGDPAAMRAGLTAVARARATTVGTITLDSYTRVGDQAAAARALADGSPLNGYPIVAHPVEVTRWVLGAAQEQGVPVQVRHGSARPEEIFAALLRTGVDATEGGPVSYCLPYSRVPLRDAVDSWAHCCEAYTRLRDVGVEPHLESFGGCLLGQLCPPSLLVAVSVLEGMFFRQHGLRSVSLSYAQQTCPEQDEEALAALRRLIDELLPELDSHVVLYTYMGVYPRTTEGALGLLGAAARLAVRGGAARLIVKTPAEAHRIPTIEENVAALEHAARVAATERRAVTSAPDTGIYAEARTLIEAVLELSDDIGTALRRAFERGHLDIPYCLHPDNAGRARGYITAQGRLAWARPGRMPVRVEHPVGGRPAEMTSDGLLAALSYVATRYDEATPPTLGPAEPVLELTPGRRHNRTSR